MQSSLNGSNGKANSDKPVLRLSSIKKDTTDAPRRATQNQGAPVAPPEALQPSRPTPQQIAAHLLSATSTKELKGRIQEVTLQDPTDDLHRILIAADGTKITAQAETLRFAQDGRLERPWGIASLREIPSGTRTYCVAVAGQEPGTFVAGFWVVRLKQK